MHDLQVRFIDGGAFTGGTELVFFFDGDSGGSGLPGLVLYRGRRHEEDQAATGNFKKVRSSP